MCYSFMGNWELFASISPTAHGWLRSFVKFGIEMTERQVKQRIANYRSSDKESNRAIETRNNWFYVNGTVIHQLYSTGLLHCSYCDVKITCENGSLDRLDNDKGHCAKNMFVSCFGCNLLRGDKISAMEFFYFRRLSAVAVGKNDDNTTLKEIKKAFGTPLTLYTLLKENFAYILVEYESVRVRMLWAVLRRLLRATNRSSNKADKPKNYNYIDELFISNEVFKKKLKKHSRKYETVDEFAEDMEDSYAYESFLPWLDIDQLSEEYSKHTIEEN